MLSTVVYSLLPLLYFFLLDTLLLLSSCRHEGVRSALPGLRGLLGIRLPVDVPVAPCSASESLIIFVLRFRCIRHFVINIINNIRIRFIIFFTWYVLWYTVHSVAYTCDLILARIWLLGFCSFINRVLQLPRLGPPFHWLADQHVYEVHGGAPAQKISASAENGSFTPCPRPFGHNFCIYLYI